MQSWYFLLIDEDTFIENLKRSIEASEFLCFSKFLSTEQLFLVTSLANLN